MPSEQKNRRTAELDRGEENNIEGEDEGRGEGAKIVEGKGKSQSKNQGLTTTTGTTYSTMHSTIIPANQSLTYVCMYVGMYRCMRVSATLILSSRLSLANAAAAAAAEAPASQHQQDRDETRPAGMANATRCDGMEWLLRWLGMAQSPVQCSAVAVGGKALPAGKGQKGLDYAAGCTVHTDIGMLSWHYKYLSLVLVYDSR